MANDISTFVLLLLFEIMVYLLNPNSALVRLNEREDFLIDVTNVLRADFSTRTAKGN